VSIYQLLGPLVMSGARSTQGLIVKLHTPLCRPSRRVGIVLCRCLAGSARSGRWIGAVCAVLSGVLLTGWMVWLADHAMRENLLDRVRLVAGAIDLQRFQALTGTAADLESPDYLRLKEQFATIRTAERKCRFIYAMGRRANGEVFFFVDSEPAGSPYESPAGQIYEEVSADYLLTVETKMALTGGPVADRWGRWISALVPLVNPRTGDLIAVLGMDIDAHDWTLAVAERAALPAGLVLLLMIGALTVMFQAYSGGGTPKPVLRRLMPIMGFILFVLVAGALLLLRQQQQEVMLEVGDLLGLADITALTALFKRILMLGAVVGTILLAGLLGLTFVILRRTDAGIQAQQGAILESELRFAVAIEGTEAGIWDWNMVKNEVVFSPQWKAMLGYEVAEIENTLDGWKRLWHPDDAETIERAVADHLAGVSEKYEIIHRCRHKNGSWRWIMTRGKILKDANGQAYRWIGTNIDITLQKQAEQELQRLTRMQAILMELSSTYISLPVDQLDDAIDRGLEKLGKFVAADRVYLFEYNDVKDSCCNTREWCNKGILPQIDERQDVPNAMIPDWVAATRRGELILIPDVQALPADSGVRQILEPQGVLSLLAIPMMDEGKCVGFAGFDSVMQHRVYGIEEQKLLTVFVQVLVNVSKRRAMEYALKETTLRAESASLAKSEFLANMSHEIRTPLNGVIGFTDLLRNTPLSPMQQEYVNNANVSGHALLGIINDILDFSKIEAGMLELESVKTDMLELLENSVDLVKLAANKKSIEILLDVDPAMPRFALVDPVRLKQVLANLLGNAVKFTEKGEVELKVACSPLADGKAKLSFSVRDTGIGISEPQKKKLFKAFSQADSSTTRKFGGTGLGLIISDMLVGKMGSKINIDSTPGVGSIFCFDILTAVEDGEKLDTTRLAQVKRCLVIDDNASNRLILEHMLQQWQVECDSCENGFDALKRIIDSAPYDAIICDYHMPYMDGLETMRMIRETLILRDGYTPVILLHSSSENAELHEKCANLGIRFRLSKPVKRDDLFAYLSNLQHPETAAPSLPMEVARETETQTNAPRPGVRILIAEDVAMNMLLIKTIVGTLIPGAVIVEAINGADAVDQYKRGVPDLVLMDVQMPEMDGLAATSVIRELETVTGRHIPIIALTAGALKGERDKCFAAGMDDFLTKPVAPEKTKAVLDKYLSGMQ